MIKLICVQSCTFRNFTKNCILQNMSEKTFRHIFLRKTSPKHYFKNSTKICPKYPSKNLTKNLSKNLSENLSKNLLKNSNSISYFPAISYISKISLMEIYHFLDTRFFLQNGSVIACSKKSERCRPAAS